MKDRRQTDVGSQEKTPEQERQLIAMGLEYLSRTGAEDLDIWSPETLMALGRKSLEPMRFDDPEFLRCANIRRRHLAIHHYPQGEERRTFRYRQH